MHGIEVTRKLKEENEALKKENEELKKTIKEIRNFVADAIEVKEQQESKENSA